MARRLDITRALQTGFLVVLVICVGQVAWWIFDEIVHTGRLHQKLSQLYEQQAEAARDLLDAGFQAEEIDRLFHDIAFTSGPERVVVNPQSLQTLRDERFHRLRRVAFEGGFFCLVLLAGIAVLAHALRQDAELRRRQQNFLAAVTHEFKSPLAALRLSAETLELRDPPLELRSRLVRRIIDDIERLEGLIGNILDTARIEEGKLKLNPERIELAELVGLAVEELETRAQGLGIAIEQVLNPVPPVNADALAVRTVLRNLLDNAVKAVQAQGGHAVRVQLTRDGAFVRLEVADDGVGFQPEEAKKLFGKFYRPGDELTRKTPGSGLGLYIVHRFVELGGGRVAAESAGPGRGARFIVHWPALLGESS